MNKQIIKTIPFITAAALLAAPVYTSAELLKTDVISAEYTAEAGDTITIEIGDVTGEAGSKVKIPVYAKNVGNGFSALQFAYDMESSFKITRGLKGDFNCNWTIGKADRAVQFLEADGMNISGDGSIGRLEIEIPADTVNGTYEITITKFEGGSYVDSETGKQNSLDSSAFTGVSGHITVTGGRDQAEAPSAESTVTPEASPSAQAAESPKDSPSPSVKPSPSPSAKTSPSVKASPSVKTSPSSGSTSSPETKTSSSPSAKASASPSSKTSPSASPEAGASASPDAKASQSADSQSSDPEMTSAQNENEAKVSDTASESEDEMIITDADGKEVVTEADGESKETEKDEKEQKSSSKKIEIAAIAGAVVAVALVLLLIFKRS